MSRGPFRSRREEIWDRIRSSSREQVIYEEMVRLGFWPADRPAPHHHNPDQARLAELQDQLKVLRTERNRLDDIEAMLKEARKRRMAEALKRRQETKARRLKERQDRAEAWKARKKTDLLYLGEGVSNALHDHARDEARLEAQGLPALSSPLLLAERMGLTLPQLRRLAFQRRVSRTTHYVRFRVPKKTGGERVISAPMPQLKAAQRWILENVLEKVPVHDAAHGFVAARSIVTNAQPHLGAEIVVNLDLKDFFPTVHYPRVWGVFRALGYSRATSTILALLCTEHEVQSVELDGELWHVAVSDRRLPQGAPTSPAVTNLLCRRLDRRLSKLAASLGFTYTRYADDLTFSGSGEAKAQVGRLLGRVRHVVAQEGFVVHPDKTRVLRRSQQQEVTGLVVNDKLAVERAELRRFRALLFQIEKDGPAGKKWGQSDDVLASAEGFANFVFMVDPAKGSALQARVRALIARFGYGSAGTPLARLQRKKGGPKPAEEAAPVSAATTPAATTPSEPPAAPAEPPSDPNAPPKKWWKLW
jgi:retron-type reverse transcriptase